MVKQPPKVIGLKKGRTPRNSQLITKKGRDKKPETSKKKVTVSDDPNILHIPLIPLNKIYISDLQPRKRVGEVGLKKLADSISIHGVLQNLLGRRKSDGRVELIFGQRRFLAAGRTGKTHVPMILMNIEDDAEILELALTENFLRENLDPFEEGEAYEKYMTLRKLSQTQTAKVFKTTQTEISRSVGLLSLGDAVRDLYYDNPIKPTKLKLLPMLKTEKEQIKMYHRIVKEGLTFPQIEELIKGEKDKGSTGQKGKGGSKQKGAPLSQVLKKTSKILFKSIDLTDFNKITDNEKKALEKAIKDTEKNLATIKKKLKG